MTLKNRVGTLLCGLFLATALVGCGNEAETEELRGFGGEVDPCFPEDCIPLAQVGGDDCPEGTEPVTNAECVDLEGECVWEFTDECVPSGGGEDPPPPPPSEGGPKPPAPADGTPPRPVAPPSHG